MTAHKPHCDAIQLPLPGGTLNADLTLPVKATRGLVLFAHGSGSSRLSPRNREVAHGLVRRGFGTLLLDLLTEGEDQEDRITREHRFNIPLLAERLTGATDWLARQPTLSTWPVGYFGASTGAAAALIAAADRPDAVSAVVSRGGRPDLADDALRRVRAPTCLIVGGADTEVLQLNKDAADQMHCTVRLEIVPGATHLFEERGALAQVQERAGAWFERYLTPPD